MRHYPKEKPAHLWRAKEIAAVALLTALCVAGRWLFSALPNIQPMTAMILLIVQGMGLIYGLLVATLSVLLSNVLLGFGPWTLAQIAAYIVVCLVFRAALLPFANSRIRWVFRAFVAGLTGFVYGLLVSTNALAFLPLSALPMYYVSGLGFDALHAASNLVFYVVLQKPLLGVIERFWLE